MDSERSEQLLRDVNAVIWPGFLGTSLPSWLAEALTQGLAGVVYFKQNIAGDDATGQQLAALSAQITGLNPLALIGADEEGGDVTRLQSGTGSLLPSAAQLGRLDDTALTEAAGAQIGALCRSVGVNLVLAPVADVNTNPANPVIGVRSFGASTELVSRHASAMTVGIRRQGVAACAKHFPGHGDTQSDSHHGLPRIELPLEQFRATHLAPFLATAAHGVQAMMSAHLVIPALGEEPATNNPRAVALLREGGFRGLLISDALDMGAIRATVGSGEGAVRAILAGLDLLCVGNPANYPGTDLDRADYLEVRNALLAAVSSGVLPLERLREAGERNRALARDLANTLGTTAPMPPPSADWPGILPRAFKGSAALTLQVPGELTVHDLRDAHNMAVDNQGSIFVDAVVGVLESTRPLRRNLRGDVPDLVIANEVRPGTVQWEALARLAELNPAAVCLNTGLSPTAPTPLATVTTFGASRLTAQAVAAVLG
ncbi:glycoside hydrolase family 3 protein [Psychromicrobium xiongbiense]|uniref:glycoside hydrolase family 3 protein n=1 Tax=Psychromicrobium xiongbiense TaxID=3051184 RepID=UPI002553F4D5|nr:glycoside hydrolase family 3 N-terminal domain-containing protein [Psychromicrobium sp. YIM S02556]